MIISIHVPKTAGTSFRLRLEAAYGARMLADYGDWVGYNTPEAIERRATRMAEMRARRDELIRDYDVIHGHFIADKYAGLFPNGRFAGFFRAPYQQAVSNYRFLLRHKGAGHPGVDEFHRVKPSLIEFIAAVPNVQATYLGQVALDDFAMVGLTEQYERSVALFGAVFAREMPPETERSTVNPERTEGETYDISPEVRQAVDRHRPADVELYRRAVERFERLAARYGV